ncbi:hypothetical protein EGW08_020410 [Elysia chlorotica]|uniref:Uncharacterized protein n=1 Tax=Elysia chlorotica TaxID=188477 RepID=A0A3S1AYV0_ELYCH|nr:hypothetical protein EGW08_020410 [Elysia chlorotica]
MKSLAILTIIALLNVTVDGTPCTKICNTQCTIQQRYCDVTGMSSTLCTTANGVCKVACTAACGCADTCAHQCGEDFAQCRTDASSSFLLYRGLNVVSCGLHLSHCARTCQLKCGFNLLSTIVNTVSSLGSLGSGNSALQYIQPQD